ncbi:hypothetical protein BDQ17DRAFT_1175940, partial [Cyathus striatus]
RISHFPESEWDSIVRGKAVNLSNVHTAINGAATDTGIIQRVGELEISLPGGPPAKKITTSGQWYAAW